MKTPEDKRKTLCAWLAVASSQPDMPTMWRKILLDACDELELLEEERDAAWAELEYYDGMGGRA